MQKATGLLAKYYEGVAKADAGVVWADCVESSTHTYMLSPAGWRHDGRKVRILVEQICNVMNCAISTLDGDNQGFLDRDRGIWQRC